MVVKFVGTGSISSKHEINGRIGPDSKRIGLKLQNNSEIGFEKVRTWSFINRGSKTSRSEHTGDPRDDINFLQYLPPKELREDEYVLSALMANSR